jgi:hypothetical protein
VYCAPFRVGSECVHVLGKPPELLRVWVASVCQGQFAQARGFHAGGVDAATVTIAAKK